LTTSRSKIGNSIPRTEDRDQVSAGESTAALQQKGPEIGPILRLLLRRNSRPRAEEVTSESDATKALWRQWDSLVLKDGVLFRQSKQRRRPVIQLIVPASKRAEFIAQCHRNTNGGHCAFRSCLTEFGGEVSGWVGADMLNATAVSVETVAASFVVDAFAVQGVFGQETPAVHPSRGLMKMQVTELSAVRGVNGRDGNVGQTAGSESSHTDVHLGGVGERLSLAGLTTSGLIDKSGDGNRSTALHLINGGDDDGPTMDVVGVKVHSTGDEYDLGRAGNVGQTAASGSGSANTNGHLGYVVERISLAGVATTRKINDRSGSREVIGLATKCGGVTVHVPAGRVDNDGAGNVDDSSINRLPEEVVGRNPRVGPVITGSADIVELTVQGDAVAVYSSVNGVYNRGTGNVWYAVSPSTVAVANVEPVLSMGFAGLDEGNGDAGQRGQPGSPGMNNDVVPVLGVHGPPVQVDADRCGQAITPGTLADDDYGSGPKRCQFGPGDQLVNKGPSLGKTNAGGALMPKSSSTVYDQQGQSTTSGAVANDVDGSGPKRCSFCPGGLLVDECQSTRNADADGADVPVSGSMGHGQHGWSTTTGQGYRGLGHLNNGVGAGRQRYKSRHNNVPVRPRSYTFGRDDDEMTSKQPMVTNEDACAGGDASSSSTQPKRAEVEWRRRRLTTTTDAEHGGVDARIAGETLSTTTTWQVHPQTVRL